MNKTECKDLEITPMQKDDAKKMQAAFLKQGWQKSLETLERYYLEQTKCQRKVFIARLNHQIAGYITVKRAGEGPFAGKLEAKDFNVFLPYRHQKIGWQLLKAAVQWAFENEDWLTLAVGLHEGYGQAQKLYVRNGFVPDGSGVWYRGRAADPYDLYNLDDELVLYLVKEKHSDDII